MSTQLLDVFFILKFLNATRMLIFLVFLDDGKRNLGQATAYARTELPSSRSC